MKQRTLLIFAILAVCITAFGQKYDRTDVNDPAVRERIQQFLASQPDYQTSAQAAVTGTDQSSTPTLATTEAGVRALRSPFYTDHLTRRVIKNPQTCLGPKTWFQCLPRLELPKLPSFTYVPAYGGTPLRLTSPTVTLTVSIMDVGPLGACKILVLKNGLPKDVIDMRGTQIDQWYDMKFYDQVGSMYAGDVYEFLIDVDGYNNGRTHNNSADIDALAVSYDSPDTFFYLLVNGIRADYRIWEKTNEYLAPRLKAVGYPVAYISLPNGTPQSNQQPFLKQLLDHIEGYGGSFFKIVTHSGGGPDTKFAMDNANFDPKFAGKLGVCGIENTDNPWLGSPHSDTSFAAFQFSPELIAVLSRLALGENEKNSVLSFVSMRPASMIPVMQDIRSRYTRTNSIGSGDNTRMLNYEEIQYVGLIDPNKTGKVSDENANESGYPRALLQYMVDTLNGQDAFYYQSNSTRILGGKKVPLQQTFVISTKWNSGDSVVPTESQEATVFGWARTLSGSPYYKVIKDVNHTSVLRKIVASVLEGAVVTSTSLAGNRQIW